MRTFTLEEAAMFLHMSPQVLSRKAREGKIVAAKPGKRWVFLEDDLVSHLRSLYAVVGQAPLSSCDEEVSLCHLTNAAISGGLASRRQADGEYANLLGLKIRS